MATLGAGRRPTQARAMRTRAALVTAARAEFSRHGFVAATAKTISERAGVATGSFYVYFEDKSAVLRELARVRFEGLLGQARAASAIPPALAPGDPAAVARELRARLETVVNAVVVHHRDDPGLHAVLTERRLRDPELARLTDSAERVLVDRMALLLRAFGHDGDCDAAAFVLLEMIDGSVHAHVLHASPLDDARFRAALVDAAMRIACPAVNRVA